MSNQAPLTILGGAVLGVLVTLTSVGAGALGVTMILCLYPLRMNAKRLVATDIVHAIPLTLVAGIGYALMGAHAEMAPGHVTIGNIDLTLLRDLLIGSIPGIILGSKLSGRVPESVLRFTLAAVLAVVGGRMLFS